MAQGPMSYLPNVFTCMGMMFNVQRGRARENTVSPEPPDPKETMENLEIHGIMVAFQIWML